MAERKGGKASKGFTQEERDAMRERARELKAAARGGAANEGNCSPCPVWSGNGVT